MGAGKDLADFGTLFVRVSHTHIFIYLARLRSKPKAIEISEISMGRSGKV